MSAQELRDEADRLVEEQRQHRGYRKTRDVEDKPCLVLDRYVPTTETEDRARRILQLRRMAASLDHA